MTRRPAAADPGPGPIGVPRVTPMGVDGSPAT